MQQRLLICVACHITQHWPSLQLVHHLHTTTVLQQQGKQSTTKAAGKQLQTDTAAIRQALNALPLHEGTCQTSPSKQASRQQIYHPGSPTNLQCIFVIVHWSCSSMGIRRVARP